MANVQLDNAQTIRIPQNLVASFGQSICLCLLPKRRASDLSIPSLLYILSKLDQSRGAGASSSSTSRGRGRGRSRGGLGKYLRARGRGRSYGRPAEFRTRLVLEDEETVELDPDSEEAKELQTKYAKRNLASNADRYAEPEPVLNSDGEVEEEPEVDLSKFLAQQRLNDQIDHDVLAQPMKRKIEEDEVDPIAARLLSRGSSESHKGKIQQIEWDEQMEEISRLKAIAEANSDLKARFRAKAEKQRSNVAFSQALASGTKQHHGVRDKDETAQAPPLPISDAAPTKPEKQEMVDFLDDLLG